MIYFKKEIKIINDATVDFSKICHIKNKAKAPYLLVINLVAKVKIYTPYFLKPKNYKYKKISNVYQDIMINHKNRTDTNEQNSFHKRIFII